VVGLERLLVVPLFAEHERDVVEIEPGLGVAHAQNRFFDPNRSPPRFGRFFVVFEAVVDAAEVGESGSQRDMIGAVGPLEYLQGRLQAVAGPAIVTHAMASGRDVAPGLAHVGMPGA